MGVVGMAVVKLADGGAGDAAGVAVAVGVVDAVGLPEAPVAAGVVVASVFPREDRMDVGNILGVCHRDEGVRGMIRREADTRCGETLSEVVTGVGVDVVCVLGTDAPAARALLAPGAASDAPDAPNATEEPNASEAPDAPDAPPPCEPPPGTPADGRNGPLGVVLGAWIPAAALALCCAAYPAGALAPLVPPPTAAPPPPPALLVRVPVPALPDRRPVLPASSPTLNGPAEGSTNGRGASITGEAKMIG